MVKQDINFLEFPIWRTVIRNTPKHYTFTDIEGYTYIATNGTPSKVDIRFLYGLMFMCQNQNWENKIISTKNKILKFCRFPANKQNYQRLEQSLEKWQGVSVVFHGTFYTKVKYEKLKFSVVEMIGFREDKKVEIRFSPEYMEKIKNSEYFKFIDLEQVSRLSSPLALRLYEILVKTFYNRITWEIDVLKLASKIPMNEKYFSDIIPKIKAAVKRIKKKTELNIKVEVVKQGRGKGKFVFEKIKAPAKPTKPKQKPAKQPAKPKLTVPQVLLNQIPEHHQPGCKQILNQIFKQDGESGLQYYIDRVVKKNPDNWGGYLRTLFELDLFTEVKEERERVMLQAAAEQEKIRVSFQRMSDSEIQALSAAGNKYAQNEQERRKK